MAFNLVKNYTKKIQGICTNHSIQSRYLCTSIPLLKKKEVQVSSIRASSDKITIKGNHSIQSRYLCTTIPLLNKKEVQVTFIRANGDKITTKGKIGDSLLDVIVNNDVDLDGFGACEGTLTCSTCHLILKKQDFDRLPDKATDEELDMLDLAYDLTDTSRLGCQIILSEDLDGLEVQIPSTVNDARKT